MIPLADGAQSNDNVVRVRDLAPGTRIKIGTLIAFYGNCRFHPRLYRYTVFEEAIADRRGRAVISIYPSIVGMIANGAVCVMRLKEINKQCPLKPEDCLGTREYAARRERLK